MASFIPKTALLMLPCACAWLTNGGRPSEEIFWYAIPRIPSIGSPANVLESEVTAEKVCAVDLIPATATASVKMGPEDVEPSPYWMENVPGCGDEVDEFAETMLLVVLCLMVSVLLYVRGRWVDRIRREEEERRRVARDDKGRPRVVDVEAAIEGHLSLAHQTIVLTHCTYPLARSPTVRG